MLFVVDGLMESEFIEMLFRSLRVNGAEKLKEIVVGSYKEWYGSNYEESKDAISSRIELLIAKFMKARIVEINPS